jgi:hypothetical protein
MRLKQALQAADRAGANTPAPDQVLLTALISGGDARLKVDPADGLNLYGCQASPRPDEISLSSSTASTVSGRGYAAAQAAFAQLEAARAGGPFTPAFAQTFTHMADEVRNAIRDRFDLPDAEVVLSPSGTDSALQALLLGRGALGRPVTSIIVAADESGNGVPAAASGRHFGASASGGGTVVKGAPIPGLACARIAIPARDADGRARSPAEIDAEVRNAVEGAIRAGNGVVLHTMDHSKLGNCGPSLACVQEVCALDRDAIQVVVDACQARLGRSALRWYLDQGFLVLITGSKFFTGPPLSGALLVPEALWGATTGHKPSAGSGSSCRHARMSGKSCGGARRWRISAPISPCRSCFAGLLWRNSRPPQCATSIASPNSTCCRQRDRCSRTASAMNSRRAPSSPSGSSATAAPSHLRRPACCTRRSIPIPHPMESRAHKRALCPVTSASRSPSPT